MNATTERNGTAPSPLATLTAQEARLARHAAGVGQLFDGVAMPGGVLDNAAGLAVAAAFRAGQRIMSYGAMIQALALGLDAQMQVEMGVIARALDANYAEMAKEVHPAGHEFERDRGCNDMSAFLGVPAAGTPRDPSPIPPPVEPAPQPRPEPPTPEPTEPGPPNTPPDAPLSRADAATVAHIERLVTPPEEEDADEGEDYPPETGNPVGRLKPVAKRGAARKKRR